VRFAENNFCGDTDSSEGGLLELALAGKRLAWVTYEYGTHFYWYLSTATVARRLPRSAAQFQLCFRGCAFGGAGDLFGSGGLIVFDTWRYRGERKVDGVLWGCKATAPGGSGQRKRR
jgi:hypothetical protein